VLPVHRAQTLTYLKLTRKHVGLLINLNVAHLKDGIERFVLGPLCPLRPLWICNSRWR